MLVVLHGCLGKFHSKWRPLSMWVGQYRFSRMNWFWEERRLGKPVLGGQTLGHFYQWAEFWGLGKAVCGDRNWATFINELRSGHIGQFMEISWKINFKLLKWLVWSSGLGRCSCGHRNPGSNPEVSPLQLFFYFFDSSLYFYLWTRFCEDEEINTTQYFIAKHLIHLKEYIIQRVYYCTHKKL